MADINHVVIIGRLTRDAELKFTANGQAVCKFSIAVNRRKKQGDDWTDEASYFDIVLWGRTGETLHQYLVKGKMVGVDGELRQERWEHDGQNRSKVEVIASTIQLLGTNQKSDDPYSPAAPEKQTQSGKSQQVADDGFADDIPF
jgi:single-strand DNA-binding protein